MTGIAEKERDAQNTPKSTMLKSRIDPYSERGDDKQSEERMCQGAMLDLEFDVQIGEERRGFTDQGEDQGFREGRLIERPYREADQQTCCGVSPAHHTGGTPGAFISHA